MFDDETLTEEEIDTYINIEELLEVTEDAIDPKDEFLIIYEDDWNEGDLT